MEKLITILLTATMLIISPLFAQNAQQASAIQASKSIAEAVEITPGAVVYGSLSEESTQVWYKVIIPADGKASFSLLSTDTNDDTRLRMDNVRLWSSVNDSLIHRNSGSWGTEIRFDVNDLKAGTYYLLVPRYYNSGTFQLSYTYEAIGYEDTEPNNTFEKALTVTNQSVSQGHLGYLYASYADMDGEDWYTFTTTLDGKISFNIKTDGNLHVDNLRLYSMGMEVLVARNAGSWGAEFSFDIYDLKAGTYYLKVPRYYGYGSYEMTTLISPNTIAIDAEPNNTIDDPISLQLGETTTGHLGYWYATTDDTDNHDWYTLTTTESGKLSITVVGEETLRIDNLQLIDQYGNTVLTTGTWGLEATVYKNNLLAGTYYIHVPRYYGYGGYTLSSTFTQALDGDVESNDLQSAAQEIQLSDTVYARIGYEKADSIDKTDWFAVSIPESGSLRFSIITASTLRIDNVQLYTDNGNLRNTGAWGSDVTFTITDLEKGNYWIRIPLYYGYGAYRFIAEFTPATLSIDAEPNDQFTSALPLISGDTLTTGQLGYYYQSEAQSDNVDWYKFTVPLDGNVFFYFQTTDGLNINNPKIYAAVDDTLNYRNTGTWGSQFSFTFSDLAAGDYYLEVPRYYGHGSYKVFYTATPNELINDTETNNNYTKSIILPETSVTGHLGYWHASDQDIDNVDWYKIYLPGDGVAIFSFKTNEGLNIDVPTLHAAVGDTAISRSRGSWGSEFNFITYDLAKGDYYLRVPRYYGCGGYTLTYKSYPNLLANDAEPNNNFHKAVTLSDHSVVTGHLGYYFDIAGNADNEDWYRMATTSTLTPSFTFITENTLTLDNPTLYATDGDSILNVNRSDSWGQIFTYAPTVSTQGYYYLRVPRYYGYGGYTLGFNVNSDSLITGNGEAIKIIPLNLKVSPNPATVQALITYELPEEGMVMLTLVSLDGKTTPLVNKWQKAGSQELIINTTDFASGTYLLSLKFGRQIVSTILIVK